MHGHNAMNVLSNICIKSRFRIDFISTICLPEGNHFLTDNFVGLHPFLAGWGANKHQGKTSSVLTDVQVSIVNRERCKQQYKSKFNFLEFNEKVSEKFYFKLSLN